MIVIGLTGSIGMGKTTLAAQFELLGAHTCSADDIVHRLLAKGGAAVEAVEATFPGVVKGGAVDRKKLGAIVFADDKKLHVLEHLLHPLVAQEELRFAERQRRRGAHVAVLEIPLLFETGAEARCDVTVVASAPPLVQYQRVMKRPNMTPEKFARILARQMPDKEKRRRADIVIPTGLGKAYSFRLLAQWLKQL